MVPKPHLEELAPAAPAPSLREVSAWHPRRWGSRAFRFIGIQWDDRGLSLSPEPWTSGKIPAILAIAFYVAVFAGSLRSSPYMNGFGYDEHLLYYQGARNFNKYGFFASGFLQDFSTSSRPEEHPFVYNHMPPGPEIFVAVLTRMLGENYKLLRFIFVAIFVGGLVCLWRFAETSLRAHGLGGAAFGVFFIHPFVMMRLIDHPMYCAFPLLAFLPLVALERYYATGRAGWLRAALAVVLVSSLYLAYQFVLMIIAFWILGRLTRMIRFEKRHLGAFIGVVAAGVLLHVLQNVLYLGPAVAFEDLRLTILNRTTGHPTGEELVPWYQSLNIVHHGTHKFDLVGLLRSIRDALYFPAAVAVTLLGLGVVTREMIRLGKYDRQTRWLHLPWRSEAGAPTSFSLLLRFCLWVLPTIAIPLLAFPAYSADYSLQGIGQFLGGIVAVAVFGCAVRELRNAAPAAADGAHRRRLVRIGAPLLVLGALGSAGYVAYKLVPRAAKVYPIARTHPYATLPKLTELVGGKVIMTNVYPGAIGFFTQEAVIGGAEFDCFPENGPPNPDAAYARHVRDYGTKNIVRPTHYVLFRIMHTGFTKYRDPVSIRRLRNQVASRYKIIYENEHYTVFELSYGKGP